MDVVLTGDFVERHETSAATLSRQAAHDAERLPQPTRSDYEATFGSAHQSLPENLSSGRPRPDDDIRVPTVIDAPILSTRPTNKGLEFMRWTLGWGRWGFRIWP